MACRSPARPARCRSARAACRAWQALRDDDRAHLSDPARRDGARAGQRLRRIRPVAAAADRTSRASSPGRAARRLPPAARCPRHRRLHSRQRRPSIRRRAATSTGSATAASTAPATDTTPAAAASFSAPAARGSLDERQRGAEPSIPRPASNPAPASPPSARPRSAGSKASARRPPNAADYQAALMARAREALSNATGVNIDDEYATAAPARAELPGLVEADRRSSTPCSRRYSRRSLEQPMRTTFHLDRVAPQLRPAPASSACSRIWCA